MLPGVSDQLIAETPITVVDTETTGLYPGGDRIIELAVVRVEPGAKPTLVLDTLLNPGRRVAATEIHGITDADVADAPTFAEVAPALVDAMQGSVFASYNVYFDVKFLQDELGRVGVNRFPPHLCLMYLRPMLSLGRKCTLRDACASSSISLSHAHHASADALAAAELWNLYLSTCRDAGIRTFGQLAALKSYKFTSSFSEGLWDAANRLEAGRSASLRPRRLVAPQTVAAAGATPSRQSALAEYWDALASAIADLELTSHEVFYLRAKQKSIGIQPSELRWLHARAFASVLATMCNDKQISDDEALALSEIARSLRELGWAPGDDPTEILEGRC